MTQKPRSWSGLLAEVERNGVGVIGLYGQEDQERLPLDLAAQASERGLILGWAKPDPGNPGFVRVWLVGHLTRSGPRMVRGGWRPRIF